MPTKTNETENKKSTTKKGTEKKAVAKKETVKKSAVKKEPAKKEVAKKTSTTKKETAKNASTKTEPVKKVVTKKASTTKKETAKNASTKTEADKKVVTKKASTTKKETVKKASTKTEADKKVVTKKASTTKKEPVKKASTKTEADKKTVTKKASTTKKEPSKKTSAKTETAKKTVDKTASTKKEVDKKTTVKKEPTKKTTTKKATTTKKEPVKKATKTTAKKETTKKVSKTTVKKETAKKVPSKKVSTKKSTDSSKVQIVEYYDLPYRYNETIIKTLYQTPDILFVYWDISDNDRENYIKEYGENFFNITRPVLIVHNDTMNYSFEVPINDFANCWYLHINDSKCNYRVELGRKPNYYNKDSIKEIQEKIHTDYIYISVSNNIETPNDHVLFNTNENNTIKYRNVKNNNETTISLFDIIKRLPSYKKSSNIPLISSKVLEMLYAGIYQYEDLSLFDNIKNPSSRGGNPSSGSMPTSW